MLPDEAGGVLAVDLKGPHRRDLVVGQEAAVADRVGTEDGSQSVNDGVGVHRRRALADAGPANPFRYPGFTQEAAHPGITRKRAFAAGGRALYTPRP